MQKAYQNIVAYGVFLNLGLYRELANYLELCFPNAWGILHRVIRCPTWKVPKVKHSFSSIWVPCLHNFQFDCSWSANIAQKFDAFFLFVGFVLFFRWSIPPILLPSLVLLIHIFDLISISAMISVWDWYILFQKHSSLKMKAWFTLALSLVSAQSP